MFATDNYSRDGFDLIVLKDLSSDTYVEIIPDCGGILHSFNVMLNGHYLNVIDNYDSKEDFKANVTSKGFKSCKLSPFACRIKDATYSLGEDTYTIKKFLLNENAIHGLLYDAHFKVTYQYANEQQAGVAIEYRYRGEEEGYPFFYDCIITYRLQKNNELILSTDIFNRDEFLIPIQDGWHPYFTLGGAIDDLLLEFQSKEHMAFDRYMIPTGKITPYSVFNDLKKIGDTFFDDCFTVKYNDTRPLCILMDPVKKIQVAIANNKSYPYLQLYTPPHRKSIAIENLSAPPDTFNNGISLKILPPDANANFTTSYKVSLL